MRLGAPLMLAGIAALLVFALWLTFRSAGEIVSSTKREEPIAAADAEALPALIAPPAYVRREDSGGAIASDSESTSSHLEPNDLVVRFLDAGGTPVSDLSVILEVKLAQPNEQGISRRYLSVWAARDGVSRCGIRIPSKTLEEAFSQARQARAEGHEVGVLLSPAFTTPACTSYTFAEFEKPAEDIELRIAGSGFVRIEALEPSGKPYVHDLNVTATIAPSTNASTSPERSTPLQHSRQIHAADSRLRVQLGQTLSLQVKDQGNLFHLHRETIAGPTSEGSEVLLRFTLHPYSFLVGRLLSLEGEPMRTQRYSSTLEVPGRGTTMSSSSTDSEGRFRVTVTQNLPPQRPAKLILQPQWNETETLNKGTLEKLAQATIEDIGLLETGEHDLGDVRLAAPDLKFLASGVVVDGAGNPVEGAQLSAWHVWPPVDQSPWDDWEFLDDASTTTNARGEFEILSKKPCRALRLGAAKQGLYLEKGLTVALGRTDVRLMLRPGTSITGSVLLPEGISSSAITIVRYPVKGNPDLRSIDSESGFRFEGCKPGVYSLHVDMQPWTLIEIPGVIVGTEQGPPDPRLQQIDLRSRLAVLRLLVLNSNGAPLAMERIRYSPANEPNRAYSAYTDAKGLAVIVQPVEVQALAVSLFGGIPQVVAWRPEQQEVRLLAPIEVELTREPPEAVPESIQLSASFTLTSAPPDGVDSHLLIPAWCGFSKEKTVCLLPVAGTYRVAWRASTNARSFELDAVTPQEIKVLAEGGIQRLRVDLPLDAFRAAIQKLGR